MNYSENRTTANGSQNTYGSMLGFISPYLSLFPYARLADNNGNPTAIVRDHSVHYVDSLQRLGFKDWKYRPLDEIQNADSYTRITDMLFKFGAKYNFIPSLNIQLKYQHEKQQVSTHNLQSEQTYFTRNLINQFVQYTPATRAFNYIIPQGGILNLGSYDWNSDNVRAQLNYDKSFSLHQLTALAGAEVREQTIGGYSRISYGYDPDYGTSVNNLNYQAFYPTNGGYGGTLPSPEGNIVQTNYRYVSYFVNGAYTYDTKYTVNLSARRDGANLFGVKTNDRITPLWSAGLGWNVSSESFYNFNWVPQLKLRASYGFNGNTFDGAPYLVGNFRNSDTYKLPVIFVYGAPNPQLRWEKVKNINVGIDFASLGNRISGSIELYRKDGLDLIETTPLAPQTGFTNYRGNNAALRTSGVDVTIQTLNLTGDFKWSSVLLFSALKDKLLKYNVAQTSSSLQSGFVGIIGKPLAAIYSYKWEGLDPSNGDPRGLLNGKISNDYAAIINNYRPDTG